MPFSLALTRRCGQGRAPPSQAADRLPCGSPAILASDELLHKMAWLNLQEQPNLSHFWHRSEEHEAALYRVALSTPLPTLVRTQVRRERGDLSVRGCCFGVTRTRAPERILVCKSGGDPLQPLLQAVVRSISAVMPDFRYTSIQVNKNLRASLHADAHNMGPSLFMEMGPFSGGGLWQLTSEGPSVLHGPRWALCNGLDPPLHATVRG